MVSVMNDTIEGDVLITGKLISFLRRDRHISRGFIYLFFFFGKARQRGQARGMRAGSKKECAVLCNFHFCCAFICFVGQ